MANQGAPFLMDPFAQHLQDQNQGQAQAHRGMPQGLISSWSDPQELHRQQNAAMLGQQLSVAHQHQTHQGTPNTMNMLANRDLASQPHRQLPRAVHPVMGSQGQYPQLGGQQQQQQQPQFSHPNMAQNLGQNINLNTNPTAQTAHPMPLPQQQTRPNPNFTPAGNYGPSLSDPALQRQFYNLQTGIASAPPQITRTPSFSSQATMQGPSSQPSIEFQRSVSMISTVEGQFRDLQQQAKTALSNCDISTLRSVKEALGENLKKAQEERDKWQRSLSNRAWPQDTIERIVNQISPLVQRWTDNANKMEQMMKSLDGAIQQVAQQTLQNNRTSNGGMPQQQWSGMQNTPQTQSNHMNPMQQRPSVGGSSQGLLSDQESIRRNLASILASHNMEPTVFVAGHLVDLYSLFAFGRRILQQSGYNNNQVWRAVGAQLGLPAEGNPLLASAQAATLLQEYYYKVNTIIEATKTSQIQNEATQPGVTPPNGLNPNLSAQTSVSPGLPGGGTTQQQMSANHTVLQRIKRVYPTVDFANISQHMLANLPAPRFEQLLRDMVAKAQLSAPNNSLGGIGLTGNNGLGVTNIGGSDPQRTGSAVQIQRGQTPAGAQQDTQQQPQQPQQSQPMPGQAPPHQMTLSPQQIAQVRAVHQQVQAMWKVRYQARENSVPSPPLNNLQAYRERLSACMSLLQILLPALGLRYYIKKDENELKNLVNFTALIVKQMTGLQTNANAFCLSLEGLNRICASLQPLANEFSALLRQINITPDLQAVMTSGEAGPRNLWGYMPQSNPMQRPGPPQSSPNQQSLSQPGFQMIGSQVSNHVGQMSTTPAPAPMPTPTTHPVPTPPHHPGQSGEPGSIAARRRNAFSDPASLSSPRSHLTPPSNVTAHTPPAASPPKGKGTRRAPASQRRRTSKAANTPTHVQTPTPAAEPASTPATVATPAPTTGQKRPLEEAETPSNQAEHPSKRAKTGTPQPPPAPSQPPPTTIAPTLVKVPTPPPQLSAPIDRSQVKTEGDAKAIVAEAFNRSAEVDSSIQNPSDLLNFLNQLMNSAPAAIEPDASTSVTESEPLPTTLADEGEGADLFDYGMYYADAGQSTVPDLEDKQNTVSPESHNDVTNTPPSQSNAPARAGTGATSKAAVVPKQEPQVNSFLGDDLLGFDTTFVPDAFSYSEPVNPLEEPWAIAQG